MLDDNSHRNVEFSLKLHETFAEIALDRQWATIRAFCSMITVFKEGGQPEHLIIGAEPTFRSMMKAAIPLVSQFSLIADHFRYNGQDRF